MVASGPPSGDEGGFLSRWSRLKRQQEPEVAKPAPAVAEPEALAIEDDRVGEGGAVTAPADLKAEAEEKERQEVLARLPALDSINATTDVTGFMHRLVPDALRNAALRAAWTADPAIRDFLNDAREYALDYNTPGAAPGYGPLTESDDIQSMVSQIFGRPVDKNLAFEPEESAEDAPNSCDRESQKVQAQDQPRPQQGEAVEAELVAVRRDNAGRTVKEGFEEQAISTHSNESMQSRSSGRDPEPGPVPALTLAPMRRRGGKATPA